MAAEIVTLQDLANFKVELLAELKTFISQPAAAQKQWLKSADVRKMLGISPGSLQNLRVNRVLPYTKMGGTLYYAYADVIKVLNDNMHNAH
jgi:hypothetical protein